MAPKTGVKPVKYALTVRHVYQFRHLGINNHIFLIALKLLVRN